jgi:hypothetical protein
MRPEETPMRELPPRVKAFKSKGLRSVRRSGTSTFDKIRLVFGTAVLLGVGGYDAVEIARRHAAATQIREMTETQIQSLSYARKADFAGRLARGGGADMWTSLRAGLENFTYPFTRPTDALVKLYANTAFDPNFMADFQPKLDKWLDYVARGEEISAARAAWAKSDLTERVHLLHPIMKKQGEIFGFPMPETWVYSEKPYDMEIVVEGCVLGTSKIQTLGTYGTGRMNMNVGADTWNNFDSMLSVIGHENIHAYQDHLVRLLENGRLDESDPRYNQVRIFSASFYDRPGSEGDSRALYLTRPSERLAWWAQNRMAEVQPLLPADIKETLKDGPGETLGVAATEESFIPDRAALLEKCRAAEAVKPGAKPASKP